jgi:hypothetical protein
MTSLEIEDETRLLPKDDRFLDDGFPSLKLFSEVCRSGLSFVRPLISGTLIDDSYGRNYGSAHPPSYGAYGRFRALLALGQSLSLRPKRVLEAAAGDAALCACLQRTGCDVTANDLRREVLERVSRKLSSSIQKKIGNSLSVVLSR